MGCDIHLTLERRVEGKWICIDTFRSHHRWNAKPNDTMDGFSFPVALSRNYERFAALAGVRGPGPEARGVPDDASETTKYLVAEWGGDGHSHSWLPLAEATAIFVKTHYGELSEHARKYPASYFFNIDDLGRPDDYRVVFWFDN